ncbi:MAG: histidine phosphatase family protein [Metallibacterium sp.]
MLLIRHAQADWGGADYDRLSALGMQQAAALGQWIARESGWRPQRLICGPRRRHQLTLAAIRDALQMAHGAAPVVEIEHDWDDADAAALLAAFRNAQPRAPELAWVAPGASPAQARALLTAVFSAWRDGALDADLPETWRAFAARITQARAALTTHPVEQVLVVNSAAAIARCAQAALQLDDDAMTALNLGLDNAALSEFSVQDGAWRLLRWNCLPHFASDSARALASTH